jgi:hypothetical protein
MLSWDGWEPSWEPSLVDGAGRPWTPMGSKALDTRPNALLWTPVDTAWRSTDQEVGCSSRPGRAIEIPCSSRRFRLFRDGPPGPGPHLVRIWSAFGPGRRPTRESHTISAWRTEWLRWWDIRYIAGILDPRRTDRWTRSRAPFLFPGVGHRAVRRPGSAVHVLARGCRCQVAKV